MNCYFDNRECNCDDMLAEHCHRDPFRDGDSEDELHHLEYVTGHREAVFGYACGGIVEARTLYE